MSSKIHGQGVYATKQIEAGEIVAVWGGTIFTAQEVIRFETVLPHFASHTVRVCEGYYLGSPSLFEFDDAELFNHCCTPTCEIEGQIVIVARQAIEPGEELTIDYDAVECETAPVDCRCGSERCRRKSSETG